MAKAKKAAAAQPEAKPKVVFDVKMPQYQYRQGDGHSIAVDRKSAGTAKPSLDCLANLRA